MTDTAAPGRTYDDQTPTERTATETYAKVEAKKSKTAPAVAAAKKLATKAGFTTDQVQLIAATAAGGADQSSINALIQQIAGDNANVPTWVGQILQRSVAKDDLAKIRKAYNDMPNVKALKNDAEVVGLLKTDSEYAHLAVSTAFAAAPQQEMAFDFGPAYGNQIVRINGDTYNALTKQWSGGMQHLPLIVKMAGRYSGDAKLAPLLMAAASATGVLGGAGDERLAAKPGETQGEGVRHHTVIELAQALPKLMDHYGGDYTLALLATKHQPIAEKLSHGGALTKDEQNTARQFLLDANYSDQTMANAGIAIDNDRWSRIVKSIDGSGGRGAGRTITLPNPNDVKDGLRSGWRAWFQGEPSDDQLASFAAHVNHAAVASQSGTASVVTDPGSVRAQAEAFARANPMYADLFGKKPGNMDEANYAQEFSSTAQQMLGVEGAGSTAAIQAGMRTGDAETTAGAAAMSKGAFTNSTFMERLAQAGQTVGRMI